MEKEVRWEPFGSASFSVPFCEVLDNSAHTTQSTYTLSVVHNCVFSVFGATVGVITRGPLELKLKKITTLEEWKGVIYYHDTEIQLQDASAVKKAITEGKM